MFEPMFESLKTATEANIQMQQELFKKWVGMFPGVPGLPAVPGVPGAGSEPIPKLQKKWAEFVAGLIKKQRETLEAQFTAGLKHIEETFRVAEIKDPEELRTKTIELWQQSFEFIRQAYEAQMRDFQAAVVRFTELMMKGAAA